MTEQEWLASTNLLELLDNLKSTQVERKKRLFAVACCRRVEPFFALRQYTEALDYVEQFADQPKSLSYFKAVRTRLHRTHEEAKKNGFTCTRQQDAAMNCVNYCFQVGVPNSLHYLTGVALDSDALALHDEQSGEPDYQRLREKVQTSVWMYQTALLRDIFGNPFRPVMLHPSWLTETVVALATGIYTEKAFDRMPVLADALEEGGCDDPNVLNHCRSDGIHVRGCWLIDKILGKE